MCQVAAKPEYKVLSSCLNMKDKCKSEIFLVHLWRHECLRVFEDKLVNIEDKKVFADQLDKVTVEKFKESLGVDEEQLLTETYFCDF